MKTTFFHAISVIALALSAQVSTANNLRISNIVVTLPDITFDIAWDNAWQAGAGPTNWDAAWVFIKYQDCVTYTYAHASLSSNSADHAVIGANPVNLTILAVSDNKGVFMYRGSGSGNIPATTVRLRLTNPVAGTWNYNVQGIEMVSIPAGEFYVGQLKAAGLPMLTSFGGGEYAGCTYPHNPITITSAYETGGIPAGGLYSHICGCQCAPAPFACCPASIAVPAAYPVGYDAFYIMKYEVTQGQYAAFLSTLTYDQQSTRLIVIPNSGINTCVLSATCANRNGLRIQTPGVNNTTPAVIGCNLDGDATFNENTGAAPGDGENIACNFLNWDELKAYMDWAALRPYTELEFEKACRGKGQTPVIAEYPWGSTLINNTGAITGATSGLNNETTANVGLDGYINYNSILTGPIRVGTPATATSNRVKAGASYYGVMEMGGNLYEHIVSTNDANGVAFTGVLGDGVLDASGNANVAGWPSSLGAGLRGSAYDGTAAYARTADRTYMNWTSNAKQANIGARGVR